jgi:fumarate hydratase subunit beta
MERVLDLPISNNTFLNDLNAGDFVYLNGIIYTARDQAHKRIIELIDNGKPLPFDLKGNFIYYCGPTPIRENNTFGSAGPTTSARMDKFAPKLLEMGLSGTIGKGQRSDNIRELCEKFSSVYLATFGGAGAYLAKTILKQELIAFEDLGAEAVYRITVKEFPAIVAFDTKGKSIF